MPAEPRTVWILEFGMYDSAGISGIYESAESAMAAHPVTAEQLARYPGAKWARVGSELEQGWDNGCEFDDYRLVSPFVVQP